MFCLCFSSFGDLGQRKSDVKIFCHGDHPSEMLFFARYCIGIYFIHNYTEQNCQKLNIVPHLDESERFWCRSGVEFDPKLTQATSGPPKPVWYCEMRSEKWFLTILLGVVVYKVNSYTIPSEKQPFWWVITLAENFDILRQDLWTFC